MTNQKPSMEVLFSPAQNEGMKPSILLPSLLVLNTALAAEPTVRIRLIDETNLVAGDRETLESKAQDILRRAGVASTWLDCPAKPSMICRLAAWKTSPVPT